MKVIKIGGGCLNGIETIGRIMDLVVERCRGQVIVVSALNGITDFLIEGMDSAMEDEETIPKIVNRIKIQHMNTARHLIAEDKVLKDFYRALNKSMVKLERLYYGLNFTKEATPRMYDIISSYGERFSALLLTAIVNARGGHALFRMPHKVGLITDGKYGDATVNMPKTEDNFKTHVLPLVNGRNILFIPGFYGVSEEGNITTFGRGGSDYSAAVAAVALNAEYLEIWKDTDGFMSADPRCVAEAELIPVLSYEEAAELAYFGAKILHPRCVEPARVKNLKITIKNTLNPDAQGSLITVSSPRTENVIKSVAHDTDIGVIKVHASGVGARRGILAIVSGKITDSGINIKSVVTSQTCISLLVRKKDLEPSRRALEDISPRPYRQVEINDDVALISIVGDGLLHQQGVAARCFSAVAGCNINVEMISFGPSRAALYFITKRSDLTNAVNAIHSTFFSSPRCGPISE